MIEWTLGHPTHLTLRGWIESLLHPDFGYCGRCGRSWSNVKGHMTYFADGHGCFPLCEPCWDGLTPQDRVPYYHQLVYEVWKQPERWDAVHAAVLKGK